MISDIKKAKGEEVSQENLIKEAEESARYCVYCTKPSKTAYMRVCF